jgi:ABC-type multidrug transport system permease subunit
LVELTLTRVREFMRDPGAVFWTFGFPVLLSIALGLAFRSAPPDKLRAALYCREACASVLERLSSERELVVHEAPLAAALEQLRKSKIDLVVEATSAGTPRLHYDPTRAEGRAAVLAARLSLSSSREEVALSPHDEPGGRYIDFLIPGLLGLNLMGSSLFGIGFTVVEARRRKLLKQLAATPMKKGHFLASFMLARLFFLIVEVTLLLGLGAVVFGVPIRGSYLAIAALSIVGALSFSGLALAVAAYPRDTQVANGVANLFMLPMWLLSGSFFSYERFPEASLPYIRALPLTALNDALRAVINDGASLTACMSQLSVLCAWAVTCFAFALKTFRWQ